ncbi:HlyU family transcriptional regulator [Endozoicomonas lisbonensis]|uniref:Transcriptional regulator n=1 Tax=Endozoicomonas lisbonensis TaxID=3120522 RepID=A0ABV2SND2_9GAMM
MGFFSKLFGLDKESEQPETVVEPVDYQGFQIYAEAKAVSSQFQVNGRICKEIDGELKTHDFIRSDLFMMPEDANEVMLRKARMFIDQMGEGIFD